ncbi:MAG TPA: hypothetical protein VFB41_01780 [Solirubrobacteraceae bacterium]|nr:hypothetical protein [Solirubrobacteraceae bacterium]
MLFDLRARGRRRTVKVIYAALAILMGGGLVFFGVGGSVGGGLFDALNSDNGSNVSDTFSKRAESLQRQVAAHPRDAKLWAELTRAQYQEATTGDGIDDSGVFTASGQKKLAAAARSWNRYLALKPKKVDDTVATLMVQALGPAGLNRLDDATTALEYVIDVRPKSFGLYSQLAQLAYLAGQTRKGDLASAKAIALAPKDQRETIKSTILEVKKQVAEQALGTSTTTTP